MISVTHRLETSEDFANIGDTIKLFRTKKGWSQADLALASGTTTGHVSRIEANKANPSFELLGKIFEALNVEVLLTNPIEETP